MIKENLLNTSVFMIGTWFAEGRVAFYPFNFIRSLVMSRLVTHCNSLALFSLFLLGVAVSLKGAVNPNSGSPPSIGYHHNMALDWFKSTEDELKVNADGSIPMAEFKRLLRSTATYAAGIPQKNLEVEQYVEYFVKHAHVTGLIVESKEYGATVNLDGGRLFNGQVGYLLASRSVSPKLAKELDRINRFTERATDSASCVKFINKRLGRGRWSQRDSAFIEIFIDVYKSSSAYWGDLDDAGDYAGVPPWVIAMADALGAGGGAAAGTVIGGPVGGVIGGVAFGATCSAIASTWGKN